MTGSSRGPSPAPHRRSGAVGRAFLAALALVIGAPAAHATGTLDCSIDDAAVSFAAQTAFSHGMGGSFNNFRAELEVKPAGKGTRVRSPSSPPRASSAV